MKRIKQAEAKLGQDQYKLRLAQPVLGTYYYYGKPSSW